MAKEKKEKQRVVTQHVSLRLTVQAAELLMRLAPSENRRGRYVSDLILRVAREAGLLEPPKTLPDAELAALQQELQELQERVQAALELHAFKTHE